MPLLDAAASTAFPTVLGAHPPMLIFTPKLVHTFIHRLRMERVDPLGAPT